ncbi:MAG TPA: hypothetical protein VEK79_06505 [Thermoanaerobaculia bacterium]|nr:hypothetical protein [Thermoanaerobaculia bacterium]
MYVLDSIRESKDWNIKIPLYHRGHLSLLPGTTVHLAWVFRDDSQPGDSSLLPEIFGTTVRHNVWSNVYRISIALYDAPGVLHMVLQSISRHGGSVLQLDSTSTERELHHNAEMMVDFASLVHEFRPGRDLSREIEGLLLADCAAHIVPSDEAGFRLRVRSVSSFRRMDNIVAKTRAHGDLRTVSEHLIQDDGSLRLDENFQTLLRDSGINTPFRYLVTSDTKDRVFRITLFPPAQQVVWCTIRHADIKGAIESITAALSTEGITLLCALNRVQEHLGHNWFEAVLSSSKWRTSMEETAKAARHQIEDILTSADLSQYRLQLFFERAQARNAMRERVTTYREAYYIRPNDRDLDLWLEERERDLQVLSETSRERSLTPAEKRYERALTLGIERVRSETGRMKRKIFLSIEFTKRNRPRIEWIESECKRAGFAVDVVKDSKDEPIIWREVIERIERATDVIAVWTPSEKTKPTKRVSPWCLWELGAANALRKGSHVLLQEGMDPLDYRLVHGVEYYYRFDDDNEFRTELARIIEKIGGSEPMALPQRRWY